MDQKLIHTLEVIRAKNKRLHSLGPTKRMEILALLRRKGIQVNILELTRAINYLKNNKK